ncbi:MAG: DUF1801 domain-containing protein [Bacteroidota bacterium]
MTSVDGYISGYPADTQKRLQQIRATILQAAPGAEEVISYQMPAFKCHGMLVYFGAYEKHIGFYPLPAGIAMFSREIAGYKHSKGAIQFPLDKPLPLQLVTKMVRFRVKKNLEKGIIKNGKNKK